MSARHVLFVYVQMPKSRRIPVFTHEMHMKRCICSFSFMTIFHVSLHNGTAKTYRYQIKCANMHSKQNNFDFSFHFFGFFHFSIFSRTNMFEKSRNPFSSYDKWRQIMAKVLWKKEIERILLLNDTLIDLSWNQMCVGFYLLAVFVWDSLHCTSPKLDVQYRRRQTFQRFIWDFCCSLPLVLSVVAASLQRHPFWLSVFYLLVMYVEPIVRCIMDNMACFSLQ